MKNDLNISDFLRMSKELWNKNKDKWSPMEPEFGKIFILYMIEEIGEVISIIKKKKIEDIMKPGQTREHFVEELSDVLMYYSDVLNRFEISSDELAKAYTKKHEKNMKRNYIEDHANS